MACIPQSTPPEAVSLLACSKAVDAADLLLLDIKAAEDTLFRKITGRGMDNTVELLNYCESIGEIDLDTACIGTRTHLRGKPIT